MKRKAGAQGAHDDRFIDLFTPKLITVLREGYSLTRLGADALAGLTVAIVALPLAMGIAIASGVGPERGLFTAIVAGFLISALGGSRFQIGGPTAAFITVVYRTIEHHGYDGLVLATFLAGFMLFIAGFMRLGTYIKYIPYPVTLGFTSGIGLTIMVSQLADFLGLHITRMPGDFVPKVWAIIHGLPGFNPAALLVGLGALVLIALLHHARPSWPRLLIAVVVSAAIVLLFHVPVETVGTKFGGVPSMLPAPQIPFFTWQKFAAVLPDAAIIALLAGIESLLSAVVADGMTGRTHRSNMELVAQGFANIVTSFFGGIPATGAIARTATNVRAGSTGPLSGMFHALFLLLFIVIAAPLAAYVPLPALAAILLIVAWNMSEVNVVGNFLVHATMGDRVVLFSTFLLTVLVDLTAGIQVGVMLAAFKFMHNMANIVEIETGTALLEHDKADVLRTKHASLNIDTGEVTVYRLHGPFFFGAASELTRIIQRINKSPTLLILDFSDVPLLDSTGGATLKSIIKSMNGNGTRVTLTAVRRTVLRSLVRYGIHRPDLDVHTAPTVADALPKTGAG